MKEDILDTIFFAVQLGSGRAWAAYHNLLRANFWRTVTLCCSVERVRVSQENTVFLKP
jgi:hypothetical protein